MDGRLGSVLVSPRQPSRCPWSTMLLDAILPLGKEAEPVYVVIMCVVVIAKLCLVGRAV